MPLIRTPEGVAVLKDWGPERIGRAYQQAQTCHGEGALAVQEALLRQPPRKPDKPRPVKVHPQLEKLVQFLRN